MINETSAGYREIPHTADWELQVWAPDLLGLLAQAAKGMYALSGTRLTGEAREVRTIAIRFSDRESTLVDFLSELLFIGEQEGIGFDGFEIEYSDQDCLVHASGAPISAQAKEVKAVTYHNLQVLETAKGLIVNIVFDV
jgi:SHS2 domain-containing protein